MSGHPADALGDVARTSLYRTTVVLVSRLRRARDQSWGLGPRWAVEVLDAVHSG